jgi:hypothetical protein
MFQYNHGHERKALEERTGAAKPRVPRRKKKETKERRIAVFSSGWWVGCDDEGQCW